MHIWGTINSAIQALQISDLASVMRDIFQFSALCYNTTVNCFSIFVLISFFFSLSNIEHYS